MEHTYSRETDARLARRTLIESGRPVSLLSYDGSRNLYVFDSYDSEREAEDTESRWPITDPRTGRRTGF